MVNFNKDNQRGKSDEKTKNSKKYGGALENNPIAGRKKKKVSGKHSRTSKLVYGLRGRKGKPENVERVSEDTEEYSSTTRFLESSLGIKSYAELAPYLVTRMFLFTLLYRLDLPPVPLVPEEKDKQEKAEYLAALSRADNLNWQPLISIWKRRLEK